MKLILLLLSLVIAAPCFAGMGMGPGPGVGAVGGGGAPAGTMLSWPTFLAPNSITINGDSGYGGTGSTHSGVYTYSLAGKVSFTATVNAAGGGTADGSGGFGGKIVASFSSLTGTYVVFVGLSPGNFSVVSNDPNCTNSGTSIGGLGGTSTAGAGGGGSSDQTGSCSDPGYSNQADCENNGGDWSTAVVQGAAGVSVSGITGGTTAANGATGYNSGAGGGVGGTGNYKNVSSVTPTNGGGSAAGTNGSVIINTSP